MPSGTLFATAFAVALAAMPAFAQSRPEVPAGARIRIVVLSPDATPGNLEHNGTATVHRTDADSIVFQMDRSYTVLAVPWWRVRELDVSEGQRRFTVAEHLGFTAASTLLGTGIAYTSWHSCNDPESEAIWSCIVLPRRLGSSVRFGMWAGLTVGVMSAIANGKHEFWRHVIRPEGVRLLMDHEARHGYRVGVSLRF